MFWENKKNNITVNYHEFTWGQKVILVGHACFLSVIKTIHVPRYVANISLTCKTELTTVQP